MNAVNNGRSLLLVKPIANAPNLVIYIIMFHVDVRRVLSNDDDDDDDDDSDDGSDDDYDRCRKKC